MAETGWVVDPVSQVELEIPPFASAERAVNRAALERAGGLRQIRFYLDGTNPWPFWEDRGEVFMPTPQDLGLSPELEADLRDWYDSWNSNVRYDGELTDQAWLASWQRRGDALAERVREEVWDFAELLPEHRKG